MTQPTDWTIEHFTDDDGRVPVQEFLAQVEKNDLKARARFRWTMEKLRAENVLVREPFVKHIEGKLWEMREESRTNIYRIFYFFFTGRRIVLLHGFQKKTQKTPRREIETALRRMNRFIQQEGGE